MIHQLIDGDLGNIPDSAKGVIFDTTDVTSPTGLERIDQMRSKIGAMINRLEHSSNNLVNQIVQTQSS